MSTLGSARCARPPRGGDDDYHDQHRAHWIDDHIASRMSLRAQYRQSRRSFGINILGSRVVVIESGSGHRGQR